MCPSCGKRVKYSEEHLGRKVKCPRCQRRLTLADSAPLVTPRQDPAPPVVLPVAAESIPEVVPVVLPAPARPGAQPAWSPLQPRPLPPFRRIALAPAAWLMTAGNVVLPLVALLAGHVWFMVGMYKAWKHVIAWSRRTGLRTPVDSAGLAVGLVYVPAFNMWWAYRFLSVGRDLNAVIRARDLDVPLANEELPSAYYALVWLTLICCVIALCVPLVLFGAALIALGSLIVLVVLSHDLSRALNAAGELLGGAE
jgi:hypothetical protein